MRRRYIIVGIIVLVVLGILFIFWPQVSGMFVGKTSQPVACTQEAKICPDGSAVGRTGPRCEFAQCPAITTPNATSTLNKPVTGDITLGIGQKGTVGAVSITLNAFVQDSRCPADVRCIQAGAVNVNVTLSDETQSETKNFPSDEVPYLFDGYKISIISVAPPRYSGREIPFNEYYITFHIEKVPGPVVPVIKTVTVGGSVTLSPVCPVMRIPPDPQCAPKPYQTTIEVFSASTEKLIATTQSLRDGTFLVALPFGEYVFKARGGNVYPRCSSVSYSLQTETTSPVLISCDTGIR